jgi:hypothetical protein
MMGMNKDQPTPLALPAPLDRTSLIVHVPRDEGEPVNVAPGWWLECYEIDGERCALWLTPYGKFLAEPPGIA